MILRIALQALLIGMIVACGIQIDENFQKFRVRWGYDKEDQPYINGFEIFVGSKAGHYDTVFEINDNTKRNYEFQYKVDQYHNVYMGLVAYYDLLVNKKKIRFRSGLVKTTHFIDPPTDLKVERR
jgi:hypothetical protein